jgi:hypothetical protein
MSRALLEKMIVVQLLQFGSRKLLLVLASRVTLGSESRETHDPILLCHKSGARI